MKVLNFFVFIFLSKPLKTPGVVIRLEANYQNEWRRMECPRDIFPKGIGDKSSRAWAEKTRFEIAYHNQIVHSIDDRGLERLGGVSKKILGGEQFSQPLEGNKIFGPGGE